MAAAAVTSSRLDPLLRATSRTIFLTLQVAPARIRRQLGTAYLFCRAADTIADTRLLPPAGRLELLHLFRAQFVREAPESAELERVRVEVGPAQAIPEERELLRRLEECFETLATFSRSDQHLVKRLVSTLTRGMEMDLERFPPEESGEVRSLEDAAALDRYCYYVAGCVGEFWTDLQLAHFVALRRWDSAAMGRKAVRFGKGLQLTNIVRDLDRDLAIGRCYLPRPVLEVLKTTPEEVRAARRRGFLRPVVHDLLALALEHYAQGWEYTLAIPRRLARLRLACAWPLLIGLRTLERLARLEDPCAPGVVTKVTRSEVRGLLRASLLRVASNRALDRLYRALEGRVRGALTAR